MALTTSMRFVAGRIARAVEEFAVAEGFAPGDYALVGSLDERTGRISLTLGTDRPIDEKRWYAGVLQSIRRAFNSTPEVMMYLGLVIQRVEGLDDLYASFLLGEDEVDLTELLERRRA